MYNNLLDINLQDEVRKIAFFIKETMSKQKKQNIVVGISGGIDSATSLYLLKNSIPLENIHALHLPYFKDKFSDAEDLVKDINLPGENMQTISIKPIVDSMIVALNIPEQDLVRKGNVMARIRMIMLYDLAKKLNALVCGTENRSEYYLGYFTRFGDEASDIEPLRQLYKTQIYELAKYLQVPQSVIEKQPSANLWPEQTDEGELGFSYKEADCVLYLYFDKKTSVEDIEKQGFRNAKKIIDFAGKNAYKHHVPYAL
jgi:NAD+ synthase